LLYALLQEEVVSTVLTTVIALEFGFCLGDAAGGFYLLHDLFRGMDRITAPGSLPEHPSIATTHAWHTYMSFPR
jgi:hypothetical protein